MTERHTDGFSSVYSLSAIFIAFAILATIMCATLPAFRTFISLPINESALNYTYTDLPTLITDSFTHSAKQIGISLAFLLCAFSLFCEPVISTVTAANGFSCGCVLFYSFVNGNDTRNITVFIFFYILYCALCVLFASVCINAHRIMFSQRPAALHTAAKLIFAFLTFGGAYCLLKLIQLILL